MAISKINTSATAKSSITKEQLLKEIEKKAYDIFIKRNGRHGNDMQDWLEAEKLVKKQYKL